LATHNYLGFAGNEVIEDAAIECVKRFGVGSCGPRGFYGTAGAILSIPDLAFFRGLFVLWKSSSILLCFSKVITKDLISAAKLVQIKRIAAWEIEVRAKYKRSRLKC